MRNAPAPNIKLVITIALKKEIPKDWLVAHHIPVLTFAALKSGALSKQDNIEAGILAVITGAGCKASEDAASWIRVHLDPSSVINIGTCGLIHRKYPLGNWISPRYVVNEEGHRLKLAAEIPILCQEKIIDVYSLISVRQPFSGDIPEALKEHDAIDMECYSQAKIFYDSHINFYCLKFGTDYSDDNITSDFNTHLSLFRQNLKKLLADMKAG